MPIVWWRRLLGGGASRRDDHASLAELAAAVRDLAAAQRKQSEQIKKLRDALQETDARWQSALDRWQKESNHARRRDMRDGLRADEKQQRRWQAELAALQGSLKVERKWRVIFARQLDALMRHLHLASLPIRPPHDLTARRFRLRSQNEEDGIILALLAKAGWTDRRFVEIGSGRSGGNAAFLAYECGWSGLMVDVEPLVIESLRRRFAHNGGVTSVVAAVSASNINDLLRQHGYEGDVDLLSIDIDSYDYWVFDQLEACSPRVLVLEYNAGFGPERSVTIPDGQPLHGAPKGYRGASLTALDALARRKGYRLVACEAGVNAFFLRHDVAPEVPGVPVAQAYRPALSRLDLDDAPEGGAGDALLTGSEGYPLVEV